jgi:hypothetical protein
MGAGDAKRVKPHVSKIPAEMYDLELNYMEMGLLARILFFTLCGEYKGCIESKSTLAKEFATSSRTIQRALQKFKDKGYLYSDKLGKLTRRVVDGNLISVNHWKASFFENNGGGHKYEKRTNNPQRPKPNPDRYKNLG